MSGFAVSYTVVFLLCPYVSCSGCSTVAASNHSCLLFVQYLAARETAGDIVGLSLRAHRGTVSCQVPYCCNQHMRTGHRTVQGGVLRKRCFDGLYGVEVAVLP